MPSGYRSLGIAALAAALLIAFGLGAFWTGLPYPQERYQTYQDGKANERGALSTVSNVAASIVERTPCDKPKSETESDLCAQWRAAKAAEKAAYWTFWGFWATLAGMALLTWQIILTREAVKDTGDATIAMRDANGLAKDTAKRQLRAYVVAKEITVLGWCAGNTPRFSVIFENTGQTPAHHVQSIVRAFSTTKSPHTKKVGFDKPDETSNSVLGPGQHYLTGCAGDAIGQQHIDALKTGAISVVFAGIIGYRDAFGTPRRTIFKAYMTASVIDINGNGKLTMCGKGNHAS